MIKNSNFVFRITTIIIIVLFLFNINITKSTISTTSPIIIDGDNNYKTPNYIINNLSKSITTVNIIKPTKSKNIHPQDSVSNYCGNYRWDILITNDQYPLIDLVNKTFINRDTQEKVDFDFTCDISPYFKGKSMKYNIGTLNSFVEYGNYSLIVEATISTNESIEIIFEFRCDEINIESIKFETLGLSNHPLPLLLPFYKDTIPIKLFMKITGFSNKIDDYFLFVVRSTFFVNIFPINNKDYFFANLQGFPTQQQFYDDWLFDIYFFNDTRYQIRIPSPFQYLNNSIDDLNLKFYPNLINTFKFHSVYTTPFISFQSKIPPNRIYSTFKLSFPSDYNAVSKIILPTSMKNNITNYLSVCYDQQWNMIPYLSNQESLPYSANFYLFTQINQTISQLIRDKNFIYNVYVFYFNTTFDYKSSFNSSTSLIEIKINITDINSFSSLLRYYQQTIEPNRVDLPFGFKEGNSKNCIYSISLYQNPFRRIFGYVSLINQIFGIDFPTLNQTDIELPTLIKFENKNLYDRTFLLRVQASDDVSGIKSVQLKFYSAATLQFDLIEGTIMNGTFELLFDVDPQDPWGPKLQFDLIIRDNTEKTRRYAKYDIVNTDPFYQIDFNYPLVSDFYIDDIKYIGFRFNNINTTNQSYYNTMYIQLFNPNISKCDSIPVVFQFYFPYEIFNIFYLDWRSDGQYWSGNILIPQNLMTGTVYYYIQNLDSTFTIYSGQLPHQSQLNVTSIEGDSFGPIIENITQISQKHLIDQDAFQIGWIIEIKDYPNGLKLGFITVRGNLDHSFYNFTISSDGSFKGNDENHESHIIVERISGDKYIGQYQLLINISTNCVSQDYEISDIYLQDSQNLFTRHEQIKDWSRSPNYLVDYPDPLIKFLGNSSLLLISINCNQPIDPSITLLNSKTTSNLLFESSSTITTSTSSELTPSTSSESSTATPTPTTSTPSTSSESSTTTPTPTTSFKPKPKPYTGSPKIIDYQILNSTIDVGSLYRNVNITIQVYELSGIKDKQIPTLFLNDDDLYFIKIKGRLISSNQTNYNYSFSTQLPVGFGLSSPILVSIYGLINNAGRWSGYSSQDLLNLGYQSIIKTKYTLSETNQQTIISRTQYTNGKFYLFGRGLKQLKSVTITKINQDSSTGSNLPPTPDNIKYYNDKNQKDYVENISRNLLSTNTSNIYYPSSNIKYDSIVEIEGFLPSLGETYSVSTNSADGIISNNIVFKPTDIVDFLLAPELPVNPPQKCIDGCGAPTRGYCSSNGCICYGNYVGLDCRSEIITNISQPLNQFELEPTFSFPNDQSPIHNIFTQISILQVREIDISNNLLVTHTLNSSLWQLKQIDQLTSEYTINVTTNNQIVTQINATLKWYDNSENIEFAEQLVSVVPSSIKYTIVISNYQFLNQFTTLEVIMKASIQSLTNTTEKCSLSTNGYTTTENLNFLKLQVDNKSLYGTFIRRGVRDFDETVPVSNSFTNNAQYLPNLNCSPNSTHSYISITLPQFRESITIDPTFSVLVDYNDPSSIDQSICSFLKQKEYERKLQIIVTIIFIGTISIFLLIWLIKLIISDQRFIRIKIFFLHLKYLFRFYTKYKDYELKEF